MVEYDNVINQQREIVYKLRKRILESTNVKDEILDKLSKQVEDVVSFSWPEHQEKPDYEKMVVEFSELIPFDDSSREASKKLLRK